MTAENAGCLAAIDPGLTGAIAFFFPLTPERASVHDMPTVGSEVETASLARLLRQHGPAMATVELVCPMPKDGAVQAFRFGAAYSAAKAVVAMSGIPMHLVTPQTCKRHSGSRAVPRARSRPARWRCGSFRRQQSTSPARKTTAGQRPLCSPNSLPTPSMADADFKRPGGASIEEPQQRPNLQAGEQVDDVLDEQFGFIRLYAEIAQRYVAAADRRDGGSRLARDRA